MQAGADAFSAFTSVIRTLARNGGGQPVVDGLCGVFSAEPVHARSHLNLLPPPTSANPTYDPVFTEGARTTRSVSESVAPGTDIGAPVEATDADDDTLTYTLGGPDAESFDIDASTGQLMTRPRWTRARSPATPSRLRRQTRPTPAPPSR